MLFKLFKKWIKLLFLNFLRNELPTLSFKLFKKTIEPLFELLKKWIEPLSKLLRNKLNN